MVVCNPLVYFDNFRLAIITVVAVVIALICICLGIIEPYLEKKKNKNKDLYSSMDYGNHKR